MESGNLGSKSQLSHRLTERLRSLRNSVGLSLPPPQMGILLLAAQGFGKDEMKTQSVVTTSCQPLIAPRDQSLTHNLENSSAR